MAILKHVGEIHQAEERFHQLNWRYGLLPELLETSTISPDFVGGRKDG
jgi:hypothetical protein